MGPGCGPGSGGWRWRMVTNDKRRFGHRGEPDNAACPPSGYTLNTFR